MFVYTQHAIQGYTRPHIVLHIICIYKILFNIICNHLKIGSLLLSLGDVPLRQFQGLHWLVFN